MPPVKQRSVGQNECSSATAHQYPICRPLAQKRTRILYIAPLESVLQRLRILCTKRWNSTTSGCAAVNAGAAGTANPWVVRTRRRTPTTLTSKRVEEAPAVSARSFTILKVSRSADNPVSKTSSRTRIWIRMAIIISNLSILPLGNHLDLI